MLDEAEARRQRARRRAESWRVEQLSEAPLPPPRSITERFRELERLRRIGFALLGIAYPDRPTPRDERRRWPLERIG